MANDENKPVTLSATMDSTEKISCWLIRVGPEVLLMLNHFLQVLISADWEFIWESSPLVLLIHRLKQGRVLRLMYWVMPFLYNNHFVFLLCLYDCDAYQFICIYFKLISALWGKHFSEKEIICNFIRLYSLVHFLVFLSAIVFPCS